MPEPFYSKRRLTRFLLATAFLITAVISALYISRPSFIVFSVRRSTDLVMAMAGSHAPSGGVAIVDIDDQSLARYGQWPWPRSLLARLIEDIERSGGTAVGLDLILAEADRTTPPGQERESHELRASASPAAASQDQILSRALAKGHSVLGYEFLFDKGGTTSHPCDLHPPSVVWISPRGSARAQPRFFQAHQVVCNLPIFTGAVSRSGFLNASPDADGILRHVPMLIEFQGALYPSLELATLMQHEGTGQIDIVRSGIDDGMTIRVGKRRIELDSAGSMTVRFAPSGGGITSVSAGTLLDDAPQPEKLRGRIVIVGSSAAGLEPTYLTVAGAITSHVQIHAQVLDNLLADRQVLRSAGLLWELLAGGVAAAVTALAVACSGVVASAAVSLLLLAVAWLGMVMVFDSSGYLLSPWLPTVLVVVNYASLTIAKGWQLQRVARRVADEALVLLKESEKKLNTIVSAVPDIIFSLDRSGRILFISHAVAKYGLLPETLVGRPVLPFIKKGHRARFLEATAEVFKGGAGNVELEAARLRTGEIWLDAHMVPSRDDAGGIVALVGVARDVTGRKLAERALADKQRQLEALNAGLEERVAEAVRDVREKDQILILQGRHAAMGEMIGNIAHQWRQPLNTLGLVVQELLITYGRADFTRSTLEQSVAKAMELVMHMSKTIDDFRNYFLNQKEKRFFSVRDVVAQTLSLVGPTLDSMGIRVEVFGAPECQVNGYQNEYAQVLLNILLNSRDAFQASSAPRRTITVTIWMQGARCIVTIADNAGGIPEEVLPKIFDPYFTTKGPDQGTGIGLYMAKTIIEKSMGGRLTARNAAGGAEFTIEV